MIPTIDPQVKHVGVSHLRKLNADTLRTLEGAIVVCDNSEPLAVIVSRETYARLQTLAQRGIETSGPSWVVTRDAGDVTQLDAVGPRLSDGRGKVTRETRGGKR